MVQIVEIGLDSIPVIRQLADDTWWTTYRPILAEEQIRYMLDTIYSEDALQRVMTEGAQRFLLLTDDAIPQGFAGYGARPEDAQVWKLHKLYVLPATQGKGYGRALIQAVRERALAAGARSLDLNVNRYNPAYQFYLKQGFRVLREEDIAIGPYWMNDYVMRLDL